MSNETVQNPRLIQQLHIQIPQKHCSLELALTHAENWINFLRTVHPKFPVNISPWVVVALTDQVISQDFYSRLHNRLPRYMNIGGMVVNHDYDDPEQQSRLGYADLVVTDDPAWLARIRKRLLKPMRLEIAIEYLNE